MISLRLFFKLKWLLCLAIYQMVAPDYASAIEIHEIQWGFSNRPVAYKLNPVSLVVENTGPTPFEGEIKFHQESLRGQQIGIALSAFTYIAPFEKKNIQFYPYITESANNWIATWDDAGKQVSQSFLSPRPLTQNVMIQLVKSNSLNRIIPGIKACPDDLFPPFSGAVDSLDEVILDHIPTWGKSRRTAFLQWIYSGGVVHLFQNSNGDPLTFPESYQPLSSLETPQFYGNGIIYRYQNRLSDLSPGELQQVLAKTSSFATHSAKKKGKLSSYSDTMNYIQLNNDEEILARLTDLSKPNQIWYFIFLISFFYLVIAGPGYYLFTRYSKNPWLYYVVYLGGTLVFCLIFLITGQQSTNRQSEIRSLVVANILPSQEIDLTTWASLGIVSGGVFDIQYVGNDHIYSSCQPYSKINGIATSGSKGTMQVHIPPNSNCSVYHRGNTRQCSFNVTVTSFLANESGVESLTLQTDSRFPDQVIQMYFLYGLNLYHMNRRNELLKFDGSTRNLASLINVNPMTETNFLTPNALTPWGTPKKTIKKEIDLIQFFPLMLQRALKLTPGEKLESPPYSPQQGKLFVLGRIPEELLPVSPAVPRREGLVLYTLEVPLDGLTH